MLIHIIYSTSLFASADTAYVVAYSVIILTTDLHSTQVDYLVFPSFSFFVGVKTPWPNLNGVRYRPVECFLNFCRASVLRLGKVRADVFSNKKEKQL